MLYSQQRTQGTPAHYIKKRPRTISKWVLNKFEMTPYSTNQNGVPTPLPQAYVSTEDQSSEATSHLPSFLLSESPDTTPNLNKEDSQYCCTEVQGQDARLAVHPRRPTGPRKSRGSDNLNREFNMGYHLERQRAVYRSAESDGTGSLSPRSRSWEESCLLQGSGGENVYGDKLQRCVDPPEDRIFGWGGNHPDPHATRHCLDPHGVPRLCQAVVHSTQHGCCLGAGCHRLARNQRRNLRRPTQCRLEQPHHCPDGQSEGQSPIRQDQENIFGQRPGYMEDQQILAPNQSDDHL